MRIHFIGADGVSMSWLAAYCESHGNIVSGSDITRGGHRAENVDNADLVVYTGAVGGDNIELCEAKRRCIPVISRAELLGQVSSTYDRVIAVGGTHGKTTVTGMLAAVMKNSAVHIGGSIGGSAGRIKGDMLICEACEYKESFLHIKRDIAIVLNAEMDHPDYYADECAVLSAFKKFSSAAETLVTTPQLAEVLCARERVVAVGAGGDCFVVSFKPKHYVEFSLWGRRLSFATPLIGAHNASNLAFAATAAALAGADDDDIAFGLTKFRGVDRRLQTVGKLGRTAIISDYAHHPHEIAASIEAVRASGMKKILTVFQPHTFSRLNALFGGFVRSLKKTETVILPVFAAREMQCGCHDAQSLCDTLAASGGVSTYAADFAAAAEIARKKAAAFDAVIIMGAGDIVILADLLAKGG